MSPAYLPLWSTGFYYERADGTGAGGSFDVAGSLRHSRGLVRDLSGTVTENQRQAEPTISDGIPADPGGRGPDRGRRDVLRFPAAAARGGVVGLQMREGVLGPFRRRQCRRAAGRRGVGQGAGRRAQAGGTGAKNQRPL